jgi:hypothetical protein
VTRDVGELDPPVAAGPGVEAPARAVDRDHHPDQRLALVEPPVPIRVAVQHDREVTGLVGAACRDPHLVVLLELVGLR